MQVWRQYDAYLSELSSRFPHEAAGIKSFYDECWRVFNPLNSIELKSLEEPRYLMAQFMASPMSCLTLAYFLPQNTGEGMGVKRGRWEGKGAVLVWHGSRVHRDRGSWPLHPLSPHPSGAVARRFIKDPELLRFIDLECFTYSTVKADLTPMVRERDKARFPVCSVIGQCKPGVADRTAPHHPFHPYLISGDKWHGAD